MKILAAIAISLVLFAGTIVLVKRLVDKIYPRSHNWRIIWIR